MNASYFRAHKHLRFAILAAACRTRFLQVEIERSDPQGLRPYRQSEQRSISTAMAAVAHLCLPVEIAWRPVNIVIGCLPPRWCDGNELYVPRAAAG